MTTLTSRRGHGELTINQAICLHQKKLENTFLLLEQIAQQHAHINKAAKTK